ncbi:signal peptide peptidase SppA [Oleidesulfovibrio sp.]|uniref:signal peptide peptidase SppA n=1 Tax=Oleidesulfovibrio sp. TaxID=2909707 RepID=UPI003A858DDC
MKLRLTTVCLMMFCLFATGCASGVKLFGGPEALQEYKLQGEGDEKILVLPVTGVIDNKPDRGFFTDKPGLVQNVVSRLRLAEMDPDIKAVILTIDSPGGSVTASDMLFNEIMRFKQRTGVRVVALQMDMATSGGYYVSIAADRILAHPSTITGSIGTIFLRPNVTGLMDKIGVEAIATKSGKFKDVGSPFRENSKEEEAILENMVMTLNSRFVGLVSQRRGLQGKEASYTDARVMTASEAHSLGLVDRIGYFDEAVEEAAKLAGLKEATVVVYRREPFPNDTPYNTVSAQAGTAPLVQVPLSQYLNVPDTGFYYLWAPEFAQ